MSPTVSPAAVPGGRDKTLVVAADGWGPSYGGINAFNLDFCLALGRLLRGAARVICLTTPVADGTRADALRQGVEIHSLPRFDLGDPAGTAQAGAELLRRAGVGRIDLAIGHDVFTGPVVTGLQSLLGGEAAVIHHMSYGSYQGVKADGQTGRRKEREQRQVLRAADIALAVGPLLRESAEELCQSETPVRMIVPGLAAIEPVVNREGVFRAIAFGRMGGEDDRIKQGRLAAAGYGRFLRNSAPLALRRRPRFNVFGLSREQYASEEEALKQLIRREAGVGLVNVFACPYTEDRQELFEELARNEVAMMLSWHEGFGLVGWEAIAAKVPLIVSKQTGLYLLLRDDQQTFGADCVSAVTVRGSDEDTPAEEDIEEVAAAVLQIAVDLPAAIARAEKLRDFLRPRYTWDGCARAALDACGWGSLVPPPAGPAPPPPGPGQAGAGRGYEPDIGRLRDTTRATHRIQTEMSVIRVGAATVKLARPCTAALVAAAQDSSLLVVGEPGAGKSGAEHDLVEALLGQGKDVVLLAVDHLAAESLGELRSELGLEHELVDVLKAWGGPEPGYLVIDALDAARSDGSARALRLLIDQVLGAAGRWHVVASVRKFDLRYSQDLHRLFAGSPATAFIDPAFGKVRHLNVPPLDDGELGQIAAQSPPLDTLVRAADPVLRELLRVPFNLRLVGELLGEGMTVEELTPLRTQLELLDRYWQARVIRDDHGGDAREAVLQRAAGEMVSRRSLRANRTAVAADPGASVPLANLLSGNVLVEWQPPLTSRPDRYVLAFSHHVLFDYAVARLLLRGDPAQLIERLEREPDLALAIRPSLVLHFQHLWTLDPAHASFWELTLRLQQAERVPEVGKVIGPSVAADLMADARDCDPLFDLLGGTT